MEILNKLEKSRFRSKFKLSLFDKCYINERGVNKIKKHAHDFFDRRLKIRLRNDGRQTPWKGHPIFIAQHATATCCRKCLERWHGINKNKILNEKEMNYCVDVVMKWIRKQ